MCVVHFKCERVFLAVAVSSFEVITILCFSSETDIKMSHWLLLLCSELAPLHIHFYWFYRNGVLAQLLPVQWDMQHREKTFPHIFLVKVWRFCIQVKQLNPIIALTAKYTKYCSSFSDDIGYLVFTFVLVYLSFWLSAYSLRRSFWGLRIFSSFYMFLFNLLLKFMAVLATHLVYHACKGH